MASRLWACHALRLDIQGIIFTPKRFGAGAEMLEWQREYLALAGVDVPMRIATLPTRVDSLIVPEQRFGTGALALGTEAYRIFINDRFAKDIAPDGPERLYLSRSRFGPKKGGVLGKAVMVHSLP